MFNAAHVSINPKLGLGVGMDLPWNKEIGFQLKTDDISHKMLLFFQNYAADFNYLFLAFQPKNLNHLDAEEYFPAYDRLFEAAESIPVRAFHHTMLNMGSPDIYEKREIAKFTNCLIERYQFQWIVEDLGIWSIKGKALPYPLPPILTKEGLGYCIKNIREWQSLLAAPICIEFPGFTEGTNFYIGRMHAFEYFAEVAQLTYSSVTIDVGHILSYQWLIGNRGANMFKDLQKLPLDRCYEIHLSGCVIKDGKFRDMHHGVLLDEQLELLKYFLDNCPNLKAITYEDPKYDRYGKLIVKSVPNYNRLLGLVNNWKRLN